MRELLHFLAAWSAIAILAAMAWVAACEASARKAKPTAPPARQPLTGYWDDSAAEHPHPLHERTLHVDATTDDEAWDAISRRAS